MREDVKKIKMMTNSGEAREFRKEGMFFFGFCSWQKNCGQKKAAIQFTTIISVGYIRDLVVLEID